MSTEQLQITGVAFLSDNHINITMHNTGTTSITITEIWVNGVKVQAEDGIIDACCQETITLEIAWVAGNTYQFKVVTSKGINSTTRLLLPLLKIITHALFACSLV